MYIQNDILWAGGNTMGKTTLVNIRMDVELKKEMEKQLINVLQ